MYFSCIKDTLMSHFVMLTYTAAMVKHGSQYLGRHNCALCSVPSSSKFQKGVLVSTSINLM